MRVKHVTSGEPDQYQESINIVLAWIEREGYTVVSVHHAISKTTGTHGNSTTYSALIVYSTEPS